MDSVEAIQACKNAGLKVYMITGDHPSTSLVSPSSRLFQSSQTIASQIGLIEEKVDIPNRQGQLEFTIQYGKNWAVVHGQFLETLSQVGFKCEENDSCFFRHNGTNSWPSHTLCSHAQLLTRLFR